MKSIENYRSFLKADLWKEFTDFETDQKKRVPRPPVQKPYPEHARLIDLVAPQDITVGEMPFRQAINLRRSHRWFTEQAMTLEELSFLLWATQGVRKVIGDNLSVLRTVPSGGARHPFETYLFVHHDRVEGLESGLYRYLSLEHKLCLLDAETVTAEQVSDACREQTWTKKSAVVFIWTAIPYRTEWRYAIVSSKLIALEAGHVCHGLYLAAEAIGAGACAIAAYAQDKIDAMLGVDGKEEFAVYVAPVGKIEEAKIVQVGPRILDACVGQYEGAGGFVITIVKKNGRLFLQLPDGEEHEMDFKSETTFLIKDLGDKGTIIKTDEGQVTRVISETFGEFSTIT